MSTGRYPLIATLDEDAFAATAEEFFEFGPRCQLDGLEALVDRHHNRTEPMVTSDGGRRYKQV